MKLSRLRMRPSGIILWGLLALVLAAIVLLAVTHEPPEPLVDVEVRPFPVRAQTVTPRAVTDTLTLPGKLEARRDAWLATERGGRITALHADRGQTVREGDLLLEVNDRIWKTHLERAHVERNEARRDAERLTALRETGAVSDRVFETASARAAHAEASVREAKIHVEQCSVRAPFDGIIDDRAVELGEFAPEGRAVLRLVAIDPLTLHLSIPERDSAAVAVGDSLPFTLDALGQESREGIVRTISFAADPQANTFRVEADVPNPDGRLRAGMIARVRLNRQTREDALTAPLAAILPRRGEEVVFLVEDGHAVRRVVAIDALVGTDAVIARGLAPGDQLVIEGHRDLADGVPVRIVGDDADEGNTP